MKLAIVVRKDLQLPKGKLAAQAAHAAVEATLRSSRPVVREWLDNGATKVVVYAQDERHLFELDALARRLHVVSAVIRDAGHTVVAPGTVTCTGIGPADDQLIDQITGTLKLI